MRRLLALLMIVSVMPLKMMEDAFGRLLDRKVSATVSESDIGLHFRGPDIQVRANNAKGVYGKGEKRVIFWTNNVHYLEVVIDESAEREYTST